MKAEERKGAKHIGKQPVLMIVGLSWGRLGAVLAPSWSILGRLGAVLGHLGAILGRLGGVLGPSWGHLGAKVGMI